MHLQKSENPDVIASLMFVIFISQSIEEIVINNLYYLLSIQNMSNTSTHFQSVRSSVIGREIIYNVTSKYTTTCDWKAISWSFHHSTKLPEAVMTDSSHSRTSSRFYWHQSYLIPAWISNYVFHKVWYEITYPFHTTCNLLYMQRFSRDQDVIHSLFWRHMLMHLKSSATQFFVQQIV